MSPDKVKVDRCALFEAIGVIESLCEKSNDDYFQELVKRLKDSEEELD